MQMHVFITCSLLLWTFLVSFAAALQCPNKCSCAGQTIICRKATFKSIPLLPNKLYGRAGGALQYLSVFGSSSLEFLPDNAIPDQLDLIRLDLAGNAIKTISSKAFANLPRLTYLSLRSNKLENLPDDIFNVIPKITELDLAVNNLTKLPLSIESLIHLKKIKLFGNPLHCDCGLYDFALNLDMLEGSFSKVTCVAPPPVAGRYLSIMGSQTKTVRNGTRHLGYFAERDPESSDLLAIWPWPHCPVRDIGGMLRPSDMATDPNMAESAPLIYIAPESVYAVEGEKAIFNCVPKGNPDPQITWILPTNITTYVRIYARRRVLLIKEVHDYFEGTFTCIVKNSLGQDARSATLKLIPTARPRIIESPPAEDNSVTIGSSINLKCSAKGRPRPTMSWIWEQRSLPKNLATSGRYTVRIENSILLPETSVINGEYPSYSTDPNINDPFYEDTSIMLMIRNISESDTDGRYVCYASNRVGSSQVSTLIRLAPKTYDTDMDKKMMNKDGMDKDSMMDKDKNMKDANGEGGEDDVLRDVIEKARKRIEKAVQDTADRLRDPTRRRTSSDIASLFRQPSRAALELAKAAEVYEVALEEVTKILRQKNEKLKAEKLDEDNAKGEFDDDRNTVNQLGVQLTTDQLAILSQLSGCQQSLTVDPCARQLCFHLHYRSIDGKCNNLHQPQWGAALHHFRRVLPPEYENGVNTPIGWNSGRKYFGFPKPSARLVSRNLLADAAKMATYKNNIDEMNRKMEMMMKEKKEKFAKMNMSEYRLGDTTQYDDHLMALRYTGLYGEAPSQSSRVNIIFDRKMDDISRESIFDEDKRSSGMLMQWGQFLDHDLDFTPVDAATSRFSDGLGCNETCINDSPCFPILVPPNDPRIQHQCIGFARSSATCGSGSTSFLTGRPHFREQLNQITSFIDASNVYGSDDLEASQLRNTIYDEGKMLVGMRTESGKQLLPFNIRGQVDCQADPNQDFVPCFKAGDHRSNENLGLLSMHTLFLREHNRLADRLRLMNPHWSGDKLYQEARKIVGARLQVITYEEWLPKVLGPKGMMLLKPYQGYDPNSNPSISNEFATAAFRFGHTLIPPIVFRLDSNWNPIAQGHLLLHQTFFAPDRLLRDGGMDPILRGLLYHGIRDDKRNPPLNTELTEKLFAMAHELSLDLAALNVQRGRDHGIPSYTAFAHFCGLLDKKYPDSFDDLSKLISSADIREKMRQVYGHPGNVDLFAAGVLEDLLPEARVGPTFACIIADQFTRSRSGDRFWYEAPGVFSKEQVAELKRSGKSLSRVICDNADNITEVTMDAFRRPQGVNDVIKCDSIKLPRFNLVYWKDCMNTAQGDDDYSFQSRDSFNRASPNQRTRRSAGCSASECAGTAKAPQPDGKGKPDDNELLARIAHLEKELFTLKKNTGKV